LLVNRRGRTEIVGDMLRCLVKGKLKTTHLMIKARIDTRTFSKYMYRLIEVGLVERDEENCFKITGSGVEFLINLGNIRELFKDILKERDIDEEADVCTIT